MTIKVTVNRASLNRKLQNLKREQVTRINRSGILQTTLSSLQADIRAGINPRTGKKFKRLQSSTIDNRKRLARSNPTDSNYSSGKANVTFTGQLVRSLRAKISSFRDRVRVTIRATGTHRGYKYKNGGRGKPIANSTLIDHLADIGYPILLISRNRLNIIRTKIVNRLNRS